MKKNLQHVIQQFYDQIHKDSVLSKNVYGVEDL